MLYLKAVPWLFRRYHCLDRNVSEGRRYPCGDGVLTMISKGTASADFRKNVSGTCPGFGDLLDSRRNQ
jgi:hypothetical protein